MRGALAALAAVVVTGGTAMAKQDDPRLDRLFERLRTAQSPGEARQAESAIWDVWLESGDAEIDRRMNAGMLAMNSGQYSSALAAFDAIVKAAPGFAEGWNKRATLLWLMGALERSVEDIGRTLALEPRHFGALSGLSLIREAQGRPFEALEALERVSELHPQLPNLLERIEQLTRQLGEPI